MSEVTAVPLRPIAKGSLTKLWVGIGIAFAAAIGFAWVGTRAQVALAQPASEFLASNAKKQGVQTTPSGLQYRIVKPGTGPRATAQDTAIVTYDGKLADGSTFDASESHGGPTPMPVGRMIPGFSEGLQLMNAGAKYRFWIPPELGYGAQAMPDPRTGKVVIPANSLLVFDVEMLGIAPPQPGMGGMGGMPPGM
ncbi:FKBP-type peptidyl-prolyl cis-trans isomerase [Sphingomonas montana]|uniref:FKBP-type peptidyl-prolyl cis-trans isomerase n=1 Tax=Sphingomonas montana TaxID=1843236 RepID=UPI00096FACCB|nr:FKBP-type peptidyl-prolyl cis-trans isomerase [Sphingomonas montana]